MSKSLKIIYSTIFGVSLLFYFISERVLRSITVTSMSKKMDTSAIISKLPAGVRDAVNHRIAVAKAENELANATSDEARLVAMNKLAMLGDEETKDTFYGEIIKRYSKLVGSYAAHRHYFYEKKKEQSVSIKQYHAIISLLEPMSRYSAWSSGLQKMEKNKATAEELVTYLKPLATYKPEYRDYYEVYSSLSKYAINVKNDQLYDTAEKKKSYCLNLKLIDEIMIEEEEKKNPKKKKKRKKKPKSKPNSKGSKK